MLLTVPVNVRLPYEVGASLFSCASITHHARPNAPQHGNQLWLRLWGINILRMFASSDNGPASHVSKPRESD